jgi:hypothetical protein
MTGSLFFDYIAFERLDPFFISFDDLVVNGNIVAGFESGKIFLTGQLLMYICLGVHNPGFYREAKVWFKVEKLTSFKLKSYATPTLSAV